MNPLIVAVAPNGARLTKSDHPALPLTADEIANTAAACLEAGACMIHLHVRDAKGRHTLDVQAYKDAVKAVRCAVGERMIIQISSEAVGVYTPDRQMAMARALKPEAISLALREIIPGEEDEINAGRFLAWLDSERVMTQHILYCKADLLRFRELRKRGVIAGTKPSVLLVLGAYDGANATPDDLIPFLKNGAETLNWMICAFGPAEAACVLAAAGKGGHARVGFENNRYLCDGTKAPGNAALVEQAAACAAPAGRRLADADDARIIMGTK